MDNQLKYHTFFAEFNGSSAADVIEQIYQDSKAGTNADFDSWWVYQKNLWQNRANMTIPESPDLPGAKEQLLDTLVKVRALIPGPKPSKSGNFA